MSAGSFGPDCELRLRETQRLPLCPSWPQRVPTALLSMDKKIRNRSLH